MKKESILIMAALFSAHTFEMGCRRSMNQPHSSCLSSDEIDANIKKSFQMSKYIKDYYDRIEKCAIQGDITLAQDMLLTNRIQMEGENKFGPDFRSSGENEHKIITFYFLVAVNSLPRINRADVVDLLCKYYYGEKAETAATLSEKSVASMVSQLILGAYVDPKHREVKGTIKIEKVQLADGSQDVSYRVFYQENSCGYIWLFSFRQFETRAGLVWLPIGWGSGGNF